MTVISHVSLRNAQAAQLIAATEGEFELIERIGHGAMGAVYVAEDVALGRQVAIKVIAPHLLADPSMVSRFKLEAQTVASLRHPNIVNIHAVREADELHYFVMEFIDGPTLRDLVKRHAPLDFDVVRAVLYQVGSALNYAHQAGRGVIHRDIKPANIMLNREGDSFLTDFGISKITEVKTGLTQTGATIGTPEYMSPEQCRGEELTGASDQYALGIVGYEMICGATPFSGTQYSVMIAHAQEPPPPIRASRPDCPPDIADAVERMLGKTPAERWPDLDAAVEAMGGRPMGFKDPVRSKIVTLVHAIEEAVEGEATVTDHDATTEVTARPVPSDPTAVTPAPAPASPAAKAAGVGQVDAIPEPSPGGRSGRWAAAGLITIAGVAAAFLGGRALLGGSATTSGASDPLDRPAEAAAPAPGDSARLAAGNGSSESSGQPAGASDPDSAGVGAGENTAPTELSGTDPTSSDEPPVGPSAGEPPPQDRTRPEDPPPSRAVPATVAVGVPDIIPVGGRRTATVTVRSASGAVLPGQAITWRSSSPGAVTVDGSGVLTGVAEGRSWIVAAAGPVRDSVEVAVRATVSTVEVVPDEAELDVGQTQPLQARVLGSDGALLSRDLVWRSSDPEVVTVEATGEARAVASGTAVLTASADGVDGAATIRVSAPAPAPPSDAQLTAEIESYLQLFVSDRDVTLALWQEGTGDADLREELEELLGRDDLTATVAEQGPATMTDGRATVTFVAAVTHRGNFGRDREGTVTFRMELTPSNSGWTVSAVRAEAFDGF